MKHGNDKSIRFVLAGEMKDVNMSYLPSVIITKFIFRNNKPLKSVVFILLKYTYFFS